MSEPVRLNPTQLASLVDEIAAMVRANRSLVPGLQTIEDARLGRIGRAAQYVRGQLEAGRSMEEALAHLDATVGFQAAAAFRLAVEGRSSEPLHRLATALRRQRETRLAARTAMVYPAVVITAGYALWVFVFTHIIAIGAMDGYERELFPAATLAIGTWLKFYWWLPPLIVLASALGWFLVVRRRPHGRAAYWLPGYWGRIAMFCDSLALQLEAGGPYAEAIRLAADIAGDDGLRRAASRSAARVERGETDDVTAGERGQPTAATGRGFPPLVACLLNQLADAAAPTASLPLQLRSLAAWYETRQHGQRRFWVRFLPAAMVTLFAGTLAFVYMLAILRPLYARIGDFG